MLSLEPEPLPPQLALLRDLLGALYATLPLLKARGKLTTFTNLKGPIQNLSSRSLKIDHLRQIKAIYPDAFGWQHVLVAAGRSGRQEEQLMLSLTPAEKLQRRHEEASVAADGTIVGTPTRKCIGGGSGGGVRTPSKAALLSPYKGASGGPATPKSGCSASLQGTMQQQREFLGLLRAHLHQNKASLGKEEELPMAPLPAPAAPLVRDSTPLRRHGSSGGGLGSLDGGAGALPLTPQTGASGRAAMSPLMTPPAKGAMTPGGGDGAVRSLVFSPVPASKQPVPRFNAGAAAPVGGTTPGRKRSALGVQLPSGTPERSGAGASPFSPRGAGTGVGQAAGMRPSRLCFETAAAEVKAQQEAGEGDAKGGLARPRRLSFEDGPARRPSKALLDDDDAADGAAAEQLAPPARQGSGSSGGGGSFTGRQLSGGLQFELKASTMALLDRAASAQVRVEQARQAAELSSRHHLDLAPSTFEVLRCVFGSKGPCAMPREQVEAQIRSRSTSKSGLCAEDAAEQLQLMLRLLPAWIRLDHPQGVALANMKQAIRIHRRTPWPELRQQLLRRVEEARQEAATAAGRDAEAAAAAEAADLARAALGAAVKRAEAAAAAQAGSGGAGQVAGASGGDGEEEVEQPSGGDQDEEAGGDQEQQQQQGCSGGGEPQAVAAASIGSGADGDADGTAVCVDGCVEVEQEDLAVCLKARVWGASQ